MLEKLRHKAGYTVARYRLGGRNQVLSFSHAMSNSRSAMVILPLDTTELRLMSSVILLMKRMFNDEKVTIVAKDHAVEVMRLLPRSRILLVRPEEINSLYLPNQELHQRISAHPPDIAVDLNLDFLLPSAYICKASGAQIRVGFERERSDIFYNFQIRPDRTLARKMIYDRLANCLQRF